MKVENDGVGLLFQRARGKNSLGRLEGIVQFRMHEDAAHNVGDEDARAVAGIKNARALARRTLRIIGGTQELVVALAEGNRLLLVPDMVARRHHIGAGIDGLEVDILGDAETAGGIFTVDDDEIELQIGNQSRQPVPDRRASGLAHHVSEKKKSHSPPRFAYVLWIASL